MFVRETFRSIERIENGVIQRKGLISGMHTEKAFKHFMKRCFFDLQMFEVEKLSNGVTRIRLPGFAFPNRKYRQRANVLLTNGKRLTQVKTLWPRHYTPKDILVVSQEIISKPENCISKVKFIGKTQDNIRAVVKLDKNGKIITTYPCWEQ